MTEVKLAEEYAENQIKHKMAVHDVFDKVKEEKWRLKNDIKAS